MGFRGPEALFSLTVDRPVLIIAPALGEAPTGLHQATVGRTWGATFKSEGESVGDDRWATPDGIVGQWRGSEGGRSLGAVHDQEFFAIWHRPGQPLPMPFGRQYFNALITQSGSLPEADLREVASQLLDHGMRSAICHGEDAQTLGGIIDGLVDEQGREIERRTIYTMVHDGEGLDDTLRYFVLPNGLAEIGLIVILGEEGHFDYAQEAWGTATGMGLCRVALCAAG